MQTAQRNQIYISNWYSVAYLLLYFFVENFFKEAEDFMNPIIFFYPPNSFTRRRCIVAETMVRCQVQNSDVREKEKKKRKTQTRCIFRAVRFLYFTTNDQFGRPKDLGHWIARQASIVAGVRGGDALDNYGAGMGVNVGYA